MATQKEGERDSVRDMEKLTRMVDSELAHGNPKFRSACIFAGKTLAAIENGDINAALAAAYDCGYSVAKSSLNYAALDAHRAKSQKAASDYDKINLAIAARLKERGHFKTPSITDIRHQVANDLHFSYRKVMRAVRAARNK